MRFIIVAGLLAMVAVAVRPKTVMGADAGGGKINLDVECRCADPVGQNFCADFKQKVRDSAGYRLADNTKAYGLGVHFSCVDLWQGIDNKLAGDMSAVSVAFTIYADSLPGEVYEDSSVFRVGKDATAEMSRKILAAIAQLVNVNAKFFDRMRAPAAALPTPTATPHVSYGE
ncbi:MAG: hypothetical protein ACREQN_18680 [Candidatus Binataceae bacterium]